MLLWFVAKNIGIVFGYMYPAYQTFKALDGKDKEARLQLLRYWAVFATFSAAEFYTDMFVSWLPFYYEIKMLLLLYLSIPFTKGSSTIYEMHMKPWLRAHQTEIDEATQQLRASIICYISAYRDRIVLSVHQSIIAFCSDKIPAALPLYMMISALVVETFKQFFGPATASSAPEAQAIGTTLQDTVNTPRTNEPDMDSDKKSEVGAKIESTIARPTLPPIHATASSDFLSKSVIASSTPNMTTPHPTLAQHGSRAVSLTSSTAASRSHRRDVSAPVTVTEPKTRAAKKQQQMQGTAMPPRIPAKPVPQLIKKDAKLEDDSILASSPSKRASNPKIMPGSPHRRSAV